MTKQTVVPKRLMKKIRRQVGKPTMWFRPKSIYDRNDFKKETNELIEEVCTCKRMDCNCKEEK